MAYDPNKNKQGGKGGANSNASANLTGIGGTIGPTSPFPSEATRMPDTQQTFGIPDASPMVKNMAANSVRNAFGFKQNTEGFDTAKYSTPPAIGSNSGIDPKDPKYRGTTQYSTPPVIGANSGIDPKAPLPPPSLDSAVNNSGLANGMREAVSYITSPTKTGNSLGSLAFDLKEKVAGNLSGVNDARLGLSRTEGAQNIASLASALANTVNPSIQEGIKSTSSLDPVSKIKAIGDITPVTEQATKTSTPIATTPQPEATKVATTPYLTASGISTKPSLSAEDKATQAKNMAVLGYQSSYAPELAGQADKRAAEIKAYEGTKPSEQPSELQITKNQLAMELNKPFRDHRFIDSLMSRISQFDKQANDQQTSSLVDGSPKGKSQEDLALEYAKQNNAALGDALNNAFDPKLNMPREPSQALGIIKSRTNGRPLGTSEIISAFNGKLPEKPELLSILNKLGEDPANIEKASKQLYN